MNTAQLGEVLGLLPKGPYSLKHLVENTFDLYAGEVKVAQLNLAPLAYTAMAESQLSPDDWNKVLKKLIEEGGAHLRWVSFAHRPLAFPDDIYLTDVTALDPLKIREEFARICGDRAYIGELYRDNIYIREQTEYQRDRDILTAKIDQQALEGLKRLQAVALLKEQYGLVKPTSEQVQAFLDQDPEIVESRKKLALLTHHSEMQVVEAMQWEIKNKNILKALDTKEQMLSMLGSHVRRELESSERTSDHTSLE